MPLKTAKLYQPHIRLLNHEQCDFTAIDQNLVTSYQNNTITVTLYWYEMLYRKYIKYQASKRVVSCLFVGRGAHLARFVSHLAQ